MATLTSRVKTFLKSNAKAGATALALIMETGEHAIACGDWTDAARLYAGLEPAQQRVARKVFATAFCITITTDAKQPSGHRAKLDRAALEASNGQPRAMLATLVQDRATLLGKAVADWIGEGKAEKPPTPLMDMITGKIAKALTDGANQADLAAELRALADKVAAYDRAKAEKAVADAKAEVKRAALGLKLA